MHDEDCHCPICEERDAILQPMKDAALLAAFVGFVLGGLLGWWLG